MRKHNSTLLYKFFFIAVYAIFSALIFSLVGLQTTEIMAQAQEDKNQSIPKHRKCKDLNNEQYIVTNSIKLETRATPYSIQMQKIVETEINKIKTVLKDIKKTRETYTQAFPKTKKYQELILDYFPIRYKGNRPFNMRTVVSFHYDASGEFNCIVLDSLNRSIEQENIWTHKIIRITFPDIQNIQLDSLRYNYRRVAYTKSFSKDVQFSILRSVFYNLLKARYKMDSQLAARNYYNAKINVWQSSL